MKRWMHMLFSPMISLVLLAGIGLETLGHVTPDDVEPFHEAAREAIASYPIRVGSWVGVDFEQHREAVKLLKPNIILSRTYRNTSAAHRYMTVEFLIVQCKDSRDMTGHYPPVCYPANGYVELRREPRDWVVGDMTIPGMEYEFEQRNAHRTFRTIVYNFMIVPRHGLARDNIALRSSAEDYQDRHYGAAQYQVVFPSDVPRELRDAIFAEMVGARLDIVKLLSSGGTYEE